MSYGRAWYQKVVVANFCFVYLWSLFPPPDHPVRSSPHAQGMSYGRAENFQLSIINFQSGKWNWYLRKACGFAKPPSYFREKPRKHNLFSNWGDSGLKFVIIWSENHSVPSQVFIAEEQFL
jgi:hypothetical protein